MDAALGVSVLGNAHRSRRGQRWPGVAGRGPPVQPPGGTGWGAQGGGQSLGRWV